jgi:hypothetical protein
MFLAEDDSLGEMPGAASGLAAQVRTLVQILYHIVAAAAMHATGAVRHTAVRAVRAAGIGRRPANQL